MKMEKNKRAIKKQAFLYQKKRRKIENFIKTQTK